MGTEVQDRRCQGHQRHPSEGRLDGLHRFKGCIPISPSGLGGQAVPEVQMERGHYEFQCLPFGLSSAPHVFTKLLKPVVALLRRQGICCIIFLDDLLIMKQTQKALEKTSQDVLTLIQVLGFWINWEKSALTPTQVIQYLGLQVDSTWAFPMDKLGSVMLSGQQERQHLDS